MKTPFRRIAIAAACLGFFGVSTAFSQEAEAETTTKTITIVNNTTFNVDRIFLSHVSEKEWGDDLLGKDEVLKPGEEIEVEIECGEWDALLVAEDESTCTVPKVNICEADTWEITADC